MKIMLKKVSTYTFIALFITQFCFVEVLHASFREEDAFVTYSTSNALHIFIDPLESAADTEKQLRVRIGTKDTTTGGGDSGEKIPFSFADEFVVGGTPHRGTSEVSSSTPLPNDLRMNLNGLELTLNSQGHLNLRGTATDPLKKIFLYSSLFLHFEDVRTEFLGIDAPMVTNRGSTHIDTLDLTMRGEKRIPRDDLTPLHNRGILKIKEGLGIDLRNSGEAILDREQQQIATYLRPTHAIRIKIKNERESTLVLRNGEFDAQGDYGLVNEGILVQENSLLAWTSASEWKPLSEGNSLPKVNKGKWITKDAETVLTLPNAEDMGIMEIGGRLEVESTAGDAIEILDGLKQVKAPSVEVTAKTLTAQEPRTYPWPLRLNILDTIVLNADLMAPFWEVYVEGTSLKSPYLERLITTGEGLEEKVLIDEEEFEAKCLSALIHMDTTKIPAKMKGEEDLPEPLDMDAALEEAAGSEDWNRRMDIIGALGRQVIKGDLPADARPFENYLRENISRFDKSFGRFLTYLMEFTALQTLPVEERRKQVKEAILTGRLGKGVFALKALDYVDGKDFESWKEIRSYTSETLDLISDELPYTAAYRHIVELNRHKYQEYNSKAPMEDRKNLYEGYHDCLEALYRDLIVDQQQVVGWYFVTKHPYWWGPLFTNLPEERGDAHYELLKQAILNIKNPGLQRKLMKNFLKTFSLPFGPTERTPDAERVHPMLSKLQEVADTIGFQEFSLLRVLKIREAQIRSGSNSSGGEEETWKNAVKKDFAHIRDTGDLIQSLFAKVLLTRLDMEKPISPGTNSSLDSVRSLFGEVKDLPETSKKYKLLAWLAPTTWGRPTKAGFDIYFEVFKSIRENLPLSEKAIKILLSASTDSPLARDENLSDEQWTLLLEEVLQIPIETFEPSTHLFLHALQNVCVNASDNALSPYDEKIVSKLKYLSSLPPYYSPPHLMPDHDTCELFLALFNEDYEKFPSMELDEEKEQMGMFMGMGNRIYMRYFNDVLARREQNKRTQPEVEEDTVKRRPLLDPSKIPPELWLQILSNLDFNEGVKRLWTVSQWFSKYLEQSLRAVDIGTSYSKKSKKSSLNVRIFDLFPNLTSCRVNYLERGQILFDRFPASLRSFSLQGINKDASPWDDSPPSVPLTLQDITPLLNRIYEWLNTDYPSSSNQRILPRLNLIIPKNVWEEMFRRHVAPSASYLYRLKIDGELSDITQERDQITSSHQPKVVESPTLEHLDLSRLPSQDVTTTLRGIRLSNLKSFMVRENAIVYLNAESTLLSTLNQLESLNILPVDMPFSMGRDLDSIGRDLELMVQMDCVPLSIIQGGALQLKQFLEATSPNRVIIFNYGMSLQSMLGSTQNVPLTHLEIGTIVHQKDPANIGSKLSPTLSSLKLYVNDGIENLCALCRNNPQIKVLRLYLNTFNGNQRSLFSNLTNLLSLPLEELHLEFVEFLHGMAREASRELDEKYIGAAKFARILSSPSTKVRSVFFPKKYEYFGVMKDILKKIQTVPGHDNGVRVEVEGSSFN